jgi:hypothetical protein
MKNYLKITIAGLIAAATLMFAAAPVAAAGVDINIGVPTVVTQPVYVQPRPVYIQPQYENEWRARQLRAAEWRNNPNNHGQTVSAAAHVRNDAKHKGHSKKHAKKHHKNKHHH